MSVCDADLCPPPDHRAKQSVLALVSTVTVNWCIIHDIVAVRIIVTDFELILTFRIICITEIVII